MFILPTVLGVFHVTKDDIKAARERVARGELLDVESKLAAGAEDSVPWKVEVNGVDPEAANDSTYEFPKAEKEEPRILVFTKNEEGEKEAVVTEKQPEEKKEAKVTDFEKSVKEAKQKKIEEPVADPKELKKIEKLFKGFLKKQKFNVTDYNGIYKLTVRRGEVDDEYIIDNGSVLGGTDYSILAKTSTGDNIFVPLGQKELAQKVLESKEFVVEDVSPIMKELFKNTAIYRFVDFTDTPWVDLLSLSGKEEFEKNISVCLSDAMQQYAAAGKVAPRFRFAEFESTSEFTIISDEGVKSPLKEIGETAPDVSTNNLMYEVSGTTVKKYENGTTVATSNIQ